MVDSDWVEVAFVDDVPADSGLAVRVSGRSLALFRHEGGIYATDDHCPHAGAPLSDGYMSGGIVTCPWHAWRFCVTDGHWADVPGSKTRLTCHETKVEDGKVFVRLATPAP